MKNIQAFPMQHQDIDRGTYHFKEGHDGMTLLDYFAAKAMRVVVKGTVGFNYSEAAKLCYDLAGAMLKERENHLNK